MTKQTFFSSALLIAALIFSAWLIRQNTTLSTPSKNSANNPDSFLMGASYIHMDEKGNVHTKIYTQKVVHYPDDSSDLTLPQITVYNEQGQPWNITANYGHSLHNSNQINLWDNVIIKQPSGSGHHELTMTTSQLTIYPDSQTAATDQPVVITQPGTVIHSVGLRADLKKGQVQLLSKSEGIYEASNNSGSEK